MNIILKKVGSVARVEATGTPEEIASFLKLSGLVDATDGTVTRMNKHEDDAPITARMDGEFQPAHPASGAREFKNYPPIFMGG